MAFVGFLFCLGDWWFLFLSFKAPFFCLNCVCSNSMSNTLALSRENTRNSWILAGGDTPCFILGMQELTWAVMGCVRDHIGNTLGCVKGLKSGYEILTKTSLLIQVLPNSSVALQRRWMPAGRHSRLLKYPLGKMELQKEAVPNVCCCFILVFCLLPSFMALFRGIHSPFWFPPFNGKNHLGLLFGIVAGGAGGHAARRRKGQNI